MTPPEHLLWSRIKNRNVLGLKFRPQHVVLGWIADFYCCSIRVAIEVDGKAHLQFDQAERDGLRDAVMRQHGIRTIRIPARLILQSLDAAVALVESRIRVWGLA